jgi:hypothetical protein
MHSPLRFTFLIAITGLIIVGCNSGGSPPVILDPSGNPVAIAKTDPNPQAVNLPVSFSGTDSYDPDGGNIQLFSWDWDNDGTYDDTGENVEYSWGNPGLYYVQLRVIDDEGQDDTLDQPLQVIIKSDLTESPVAIAHADPNPQLINSPVSFSASGSYDPDGGDIQLYEWDWNNDGIYEETGAEIEKSWSEAGFYFVQLRVTDDEGDTDILDEPLEIVITTEPAEVPIAKAQADPISQIVCAPVHFTDDGSYDPDGGLITQYEWDWDNDGVFDETGSDVYHTWDTPGTYLVQLRVTDDEHQTGMLDSPIQVSITSAIPTAVAVADHYFPGFIGDTVHFDGSGSYDNDCGGESITKWEWDFNGDGYSWLDAGPTPSHSYSIYYGEYHVQLRVTDDEGDQDELDVPLDIKFLHGTPLGFDWAKRAGGNWYDTSGGLTALSDNSIVVTGCFSDIAVFGEGEINETTLVSKGLWDFFIAKFNPDSTVAWARGSGGLGLDSGHWITSLSDESTVVTGSFQETVIFGEGEGNQVELTSAGGYDIFIARYNTDGTLAWAKRAGGPDNDHASYPLTRLSDNSIIVTGQFNGTVTFGEGEINQTLLVAENDDVFIACYNPDGSLKWVKCAGGSGSNTSRTITTLSDNSFVITGNYQISITFGKGEINETELTDPGSNNMFIARYYSDGSLAWAKSAEGVFIFGPICNAITSISDNSIFVAGTLHGGATFGKGEPNETALHCHGNNNLFIARYNLDGSLAWAICDGGGDNADTEGLGITAINDDYILVTGDLYGEVHFGTGQPDEEVLTSEGESDIYLARYDCNGGFAWAMSFGGSGTDDVSGIARLSDHSFALTGYFNSSVTFGPGDPGETTLVSAGGFDIFIAKYSY